MRKGEVRQTTRRTGRHTPAPLSHELQRIQHESSHKHQAASCNVYRNPLLTRTTQVVRAPAVFAFGVGGVCVRNKPVRTSIGRTGGCRWGFQTSRGGLEGEELSHRSHAQSREEARRFQRHLPLCSQSINGPTHNAKVARATHRPKHRYRGDTNGVAVLMILRAVHTSTTHMVRPKPISIIPTCT